MSESFLVVNREDMAKRNWDELDFLFISGDAYVDHPSFSTTVIARMLESKGYKVGLICQPDWKNLDSFKVLGKPRLAVLVNAGNLDSMLNKYTAAKKERNKDVYSPGGRTGYRPDRATIVYCNKIREIWKSIPIIIGGIEASLRRFTHYDYWSNSIRRSILMDSNADLLIYGMGERQIVEIADYLSGAMSIKDITFIDGTCFLTKNLEIVKDYLMLPSHEEILKDKQKFAKAFQIQEYNQDHINGKDIVQKVANFYLVQKKPSKPLTTKEMDEVYDLPYTRTYHPSYEKDGGIPALEEVQCSIISHRGCFGSCSFCAIHSHQGRTIQNRSHESILKEALFITKLDNFKGYINDLGGPTANFRQKSCEKQITEGVCKDRQCLFPTPCPNLDANHKDYIDLLRKIRSVKGIKKVFIRSGVRYDYIFADKDNDFLTELCRFHVSGQLKVAPEHINNNVLRLMRKSPKDIYMKFLNRYKKTNENIGKKQYLVPYFISSHPGSTLNDAIELAEFIRDTGSYHQQVQDFIPTPGSASTAMYVSEIDIYTGEKIFVAKKTIDKAMQRALLQYKNPKNYHLVSLALEKAGRKDLIGFTQKALIKPRHKNNKIKKIQKK